MKKTVKCITAWSLEPRLVVGQEYDLIRCYYQNGEGHMLVEDDTGSFSAPDVFFSEPSGGWDGVPGYESLKGKTLSELLAEAATDDELWDD